MTAEQLRDARNKKGWTQKRVAADLGVSQPYLSLLEKGVRPVPDGLGIKAVKLLGMSPANLPMDMKATGSSTNEDALMHDLAALGYPGYAYLRGKRKRNPAQVLLLALCKNNLDSRMTEALPWVVFNYPEMNWDWLLKQAKANEIQNRLGYVTTLARKMAELRQPGVAQALTRHESALEHARLAREDTLCHDSLSEAEKRWLKDRRPEEAKHWNLLTDLSLDHLNYAR